MSEANERLRILEMIDNGVITPAQGFELLKALGGAETESPPEELPEELTEPSESLTPDIPPQPDTPPLEDESAAEPVVTAEVLEEEPVSPSTPKIDPKIGSWRRWWWVPMWVGVGITVVSGLLMFLAWNAGGFGFWFACTWFPFFLGVAVMALAWSSRTARWLHVRVHQEPGEWPQNIAISLPLPLRLTAWFLRTFRHQIPNLENTALDELILALEKTSPDAPFYVEVNEGEDGERVEVYIG